MNGKSPFHISVQNINDNETVNYRLILIKGAIESKGLIVSNGNAKYITCYTKSLPNSFGEWPVYNGFFKCLALLQGGTNEIVLQFADSTKILSVQMKCHDTDLCITPVYVICKGHDGHFQAPPGADNSVESASQRIGLGMKMAQCLFAEKLKEREFPRKSFQLESDLDPERAECYIFHSQLEVGDATSMSQEDLWEFIGRELMMSDLGNEARKFVAFLSCTYWDGNKAQADAALGGGGLALLGSACLHTWPSSISEISKCFTNDEPIQPNLMDNSCYRGTYAACLSTSLGSCCHEVGHMFNLGHSESGIMSRGFDYTHRVFLAVPPESVVTPVSPPSTTVSVVPSLQVTTGPFQPPTQKPPPPKKESFEQDDFTHLSPGCAAILAHHKWFNNTTQESNIEYDSMRSIVSSEVGLRVVQLRGEGGAVRKSWEVGSKAPRKHLVLPRGTCASTLVAIDSNGTILTAPL